MTNPTTATNTKGQTNGIAVDSYRDPIYVGSSVRRYGDFRKTMTVARLNGTKVYTCWNGRERLWTGTQLVNLAPGPRQQRSL